MLPKQTAKHYILSSSPHTHAKSSVSGLMLDVIIALLPALCCSVWFFGWKALLLAGTCIASCLATEALCRLAMKRESSIGDLSAVLTGLLLALNLPPDLPLWMAVVGGAFAIAIAKQVFGGLGYNPFNPALAARAFMLVSFSEAMTHWSASGWKLAAGPLTGPGAADALTTATPLQYLKTFATAAWDKLPSADQALNFAQPSFLKAAFFGNVNGCLGEVCSIALLLGAAYLLFRRVITWHIPVAFIGTVAVYAFFNYGMNLTALKLAEVHVLSGGVILGACFMATDYVTSPITAKGKLIFGCGCGLLTMLIRTQGSFPEGVSFAILIMNAFTPLISRFTQPKPFGAK